jgi:hypothetical protein
MFDFHKANEMICTVEEERSISAFEASVELRRSVNISSLVNQANHFEIVTDSDAKQALSMTLQAKKMKNKLDCVRKDLISPHLEFQRTVNRVANELEDSLDGIEGNLKHRIELWIESENIEDVCIEVPDGTLFTTNKWGFSIVKDSLIPREYLCIDEKKVKEAIKNGIRNIEGIEIKANKEISTRVKN